jgi:hypothetical protein
VGGDPRGVRSANVPVLLPEDAGRRDLGIVLVSGALKYKASLIPFQIGFGLGFLFGLEMEVT